MDAVLQKAIQTQSRALLDLFNVEKVSMEVQAKPMRPIGQSGQMIDGYA